MSKDDVGPKRPPREEDPSYITMPPELRAYDTGPLEDTAIKPGDDPILDAAVAGISDQCRSFFSSASPVSG